MNKSTSRNIIIAAAVIILLIVAMSFRNSQPERTITETATPKTGDTQLETCRDFEQAELQINGQPLSVALATTTAEKARGLSGCASVPEKSGMYFVYDTPRQVQFWMKDMLIPLDIIWIADGTVIGIEAGVPPADPADTDPPRYQPSEAITGVLEVPAGQAEALGIRIGSTATIQAN